MFSHRIGTACIGPTNFAPNTNPLWRGGSPPSGCAAAPAFFSQTASAGLTTAAQPNGGKPPRHGVGVRLAGVFAQYRNGMHRSHQFRAQHKPLVARGLAPVGLRSGPSLLQPNSISRFDDCCAAERGQAPSPRGWCELLVIKSGLAATSGIGRRPVGSFRR